MFYYILRQLNTEFLFCFVFLCFLIVRSGTVASAGRSIFEMTYNMGCVMLCRCSRVARYWNIMLSVSSYTFYTDCILVKLKLSIRCCSVSVVHCDRVKIWALIEYLWQALCRRLCTCWSTARIWPSAMYSFCIFHSFQAAWNAQDADYCEQCERCLSVTWLNSAVHSLPNYSVFLLCCFTLDELVVLYSQ